MTAASVIRGPLVAAIACMGIDWGRALEAAPPQAAVPPPAAEVAPVVRPIRLPEGGLQPRAVADAKGALHVVYLRGDPKAANVWYVCKDSAGASFSQPIRVNSQDGAGVAVGTIRGPQIALGRDDRVHVAWNGSSAALPRGPKQPNGEVSDPMLYARMNDERTAFEPQRCVATSTFALDGGGSLATDGEGRVYIGWHAAFGDGPLDESQRRFWVASSDDDGKTFAPEHAASTERLGACACCGTAGFSDSAGTLHFLYRVATNSEHRDIFWLRSTNRGKSFIAQKVDEWTVNQCPVSTVSLAQALGAAEKPGDIAMAWETRGQVYFARINPKSYQCSAPVAPAGETTRRKHPALALDRKGRILLAWTESPGWSQPGGAAWEVFDEHNKSVASTRQIREGDQGVQTWNSVAAVCVEGQFFVVY